ncbi:ArsR/SmtB family transcription factor [Flavobacterium sp. JP2137]|uniref:ArsR/SmtB family transcription factor n=1 Tax=Flavobacterium sp. JP2137 TaxID=3414510 RepID=UPI003D2FF37D
MGITKSELFSQKKNSLADMFKVLAHPARLAILQHIIDERACICGDLVVELGLAQATVSQHLKELKNCGLLKGTVEGKSICYCIDPEVWQEFYRAFGQFFNRDVSAGNSDCC